MKRIMIMVGIVLGVVLCVWMVKLVLLVRSVGQYASYWQQAAALPAENQLRYIALGDSAAQGVGARAPQKGYVGLITEALSKKHDTSVHVTNLSVSGATVQDVLDVQIPRLQTMTVTPDTIVTIEIGANNMKQYEHTSFKQQIEQLFANLPKQTVVSTVPYFGRGRHWRFEKNTGPANEVIQAAAKKHGLRVAPLYAVTKQRDNPTVYAADYFHPSDKGYQNWFTAFWEVLDASFEGSLKNY